MRGEQFGELAQNEAPPEERGDDKHECGGSGLLFATYAVVAAGRAGLVCSACSLSPMCRLSAEQ